MKQLILILLLSSAGLRGACLPITGSRILGRDLAAAEPGLANLPETLTVAFAPAPGTKRIFSAFELARIAKVNAIAFEPVADLCFEVPLRNLSADEALTAMHRVLPAGAEITLVELQRTSVPAGTLEFPLSGLQPITAGVDGERAQLWRGFVTYAETKRAPFWARVVLASHPLSARGPVSVHEAPPGTPGTDEIHRGDMVRVDVECGRAHLVVEAVALSGGHAGDLVDLRNPATGKTFKARVLTASQARIVLSEGQAL